MPLTLSPDFFDGGFSSCSSVEEEDDEDEDDEDSGAAASSSGANHQICARFLNENDFKRLKGEKDSGNEEALKCCVCYSDTDLQTHRVISCGHFACSKCLEKIEECPLCRVRFTGGKKRKR